MSSKTATCFSVGDLIVYPAHGVGRITAIETQVMYGDALELFVISVEREGLRLMVPKRRARVSGMRPLVARAEAERALGVLSGKARGKTGTWARRAQEYEKKINSGDLLLAAEVVRDLRSGSVSGSGSYSERQIFERALDRVSRELGPVLGRDTDQIRREIEAGPSAKAA
jgi:CarD family transcriptional regulator